MERSMKSNFYISYKKITIFWIMAILIISVFMISCSPSGTSQKNIDPGALTEAERYLSKLIEKWSGTNPGSIDKISDIQEVQEYSWGYNFTYTIYYYSGTTQIGILEILRNEDGTYKAKSLSVE
jgi:hypothetical protein